MEEVLPCASGWLRQGRKRCTLNPVLPERTATASSFNSKLRDEFLNGETFYSLKEVPVLSQRWWVYYNTARPHLSLGQRGWWATLSRHWSAWRLRSFRVVKVRAAQNEWRTYWMARSTRPF